MLSNSALPTPNSFTYTAIKLLDGTRGGGCQPPLSAPTPDGDTGAPAATPHVGRDLSISECRMRPDSVVAILASPVRALQRQLAKDAATHFRRICRWGKKARAFWAIEWPPRSASLLGSIQGGSSHARRIRRHPDQPARYLEPLAH